MIKAVFFDLDGVLLNSETYLQGLTEEFLKYDNSPIPPDRFHQLIGSHKSMNLWSKILEGIELNETIEGFRARMRAYKLDKIEKKDFSTLIFPEVKETLEILKRNGIRITCASSSAIPYIKKALKNGIFELFDLVVSCDDFEHSKPEPDIYLYCQKYFDLDADECLVVEDSPIGISAGKAANIKVIARKDYNFDLDQSEADYYIDDLSELEDYLKND